VAGKALQRFEDAEEVGALIGEELGEGGLAGVEVSARIISRIASMRSPSKNMCSVRVRPMPTAPNAIALAGLLGRVGVGADLKLGGLGAPLHELGVALEFLGGLRGFVAVEEAGDDLGRSGRDLAGVTVPEVPSMERKSPSLKVWPSMVAVFLS
jgi:hypothetical protein